MPQVLSILQQQEMSGERQVNYVRCGFAALTVLVLSTAWSAQTVRADYIFLITILLWTAYSAFVWALLQRLRYSGWLKYASITLDVTALYGSQLASLANHSHVYEVYRAPMPWVILAAFNSLTALRYSVAASLYSGALTVGYGVVFLAYVKTAYAVRWLETSNFIGEGLNSADCVFCFVMAALPSVFAAVIARNSRRLVVRAASESLERARLERENRAEHALREAQRRLAASEKLSALGRLLAQVSHEINNPINVIYNNLRPMEDYLHTLTEAVDVWRRSGVRPVELPEDEELTFARDDFARALETVRVAAQRVRSIHTDMMVSVRGQTVQKSKGSLNDAVCETVRIVRQGQSARVIFVEEYGDVPSMVFNDGQIKQVTLNLLRNAIHAVGDRGRIEVRTRVRDEGAELVVHDDGPGVPADLRDQIFEPLFTTKEVGEGSGLGLAICRQFVVQGHGGTVDLDGRSATGARFVVWIPFATPETPAQDDALAGGQPARE